MGRHCEIVDFNNRPVRLLVEPDRRIWICLYDICKIVKRPVMMETKEAMNLCPSATKIIFTDEGKPLWAIAPRDVRRLLHLVKKENAPMKKLCEQLETWAGGLAAQPQETAQAEAEPVTCLYEGYPVSFTAKNGKIRVNATVMAKRFGANPAEWLRKAATLRCRERLVAQGKSVTVQEQVVTSRGTSGGTWMQSELAIEYARALCPDFAAWLEDCIGKLTGKEAAAVSTPAERNGDFPVPKTFEEALLLAARQQKEIEENRVKVEFYNRFIEDRDWFKTTTIADELQVTPGTLNRFLEEEGIIRREKRQWVTPGYHSSLQCEVPYYWTNSMGKSYKFGTVRRWTKAGREFIIELWNKKHITNH